MQTINEYFDFIKATIRRHPIIQDESVNFEIKTSSAGVVKGRLILIEGTKLEFAEYVTITHGKPNKVKYRYTWLNQTDKVILRWDNAPHHAELPTHPHHRHDVDKVLETEEASIESVLSELERKLVGL